MSEILDQVFPLEQCLPEESILLIEELTGEDIVRFFKIAGPVRYGRPGQHAHLDSPFTATYSYIQRVGMNYDALHKFSNEMAEARQKLQDV